MASNALFHLIDMAVINVWFLYRRNFARCTNVNNLSCLTLHEFKELVSAYPRDRAVHYLGPLGGHLQHPSMRLIICTKLIGLTPFTLWYLQAMCLLT